MPGEPSPYAILGLDPSAGPAEVERAYKRLIKRHHPDHEGGDGARAAEIINAYRRIRRMRLERSLPVRVDRPSAPGRRRSWWPLLAGALALAVYWQFDALRDLADGPALIGGSPRPALAYEPGAGAILPAALADAPVNGDAIERAVLQAARLIQAGDRARLLDQSRLCHARLRREPDPARLDGCVAFDEAVVALTQADQLRDVGPFSPSAVTARQLAAARLLSNDYLAIDSRLGQIRAEVELALAPPDPPPLAPRARP